MNGLLGATDVYRKGQWEIKKCARKISRKAWVALQGNHVLGEKSRRIARCKHIEAGKHTLVERRQDA